MDGKEKQYVWMDGKMVEKEHAMVPIMTHGLHYGTGVFEGIRIYQTPKGKAVFRLRDHMVRFEQSAKALNMKLPYSVDEMCEAVREVVRVNPARMDYIRPIAYYGQNKEDKIVLNPASFSTNVAVALAHMGAYLGKENMEKGAKVITVSWQKPTNACTSLQAKSAARIFPLPGRSSPPARIQSPGPCLPLRPSPGPGKSLAQTEFSIMQI